MKGRNPARGVALAAALLAALAGPAAGESGPGPAARTAAGLVEGLSRAFRTGDLDRLSAFLGQDVVVHGTGPEGSSRGLRATVEALRSALAELEWKPELVVAEGEKIAILGKITGLHRGPLLGVPPTGAPVAIASVDLFRLKEGRIAEHWALTDRFELVRALTNPGPAPAPLVPAPVTEVAAFPAGEFLESVAVDAEGNLLVTHLFTGRITKIDPRGGTSVLANLETGLPPGPLDLDFSKPVPRAGLVCIALARDGTIYATFFSPNPEAHGVWKITPDGKGAPYAPIPGAMVNGIALDGAENLYVADSHGKLWRVPAGSRRAEVWLEHPLLLRRPFVGFLPGPNGIQLWNGSLFVANSDTGNILRVPIQPDGSAGRPEVFAGGVCGDDFAIDSAGTLYVTTHAYNSVLRITQDGRRSVIATAAQGAAGPTAAAFGRAPADGESLYVVTDGGLFAPVPGIEIRPRVLRLKVPSGGEPK
ncbi:MAG: ester cyclase [Deltaproteobacteria bacterium]|nr:ester cyclase [Deltaproteobacteria bacterium]